MSIVCSRRIIMIFAVRDFISVVSNKLKRACVCVCVSWTRGWQQLEPSLSLTCATVHRTPTQRASETGSHTHFRTSYYYYYEAHKNMQSIYIANWMAYKFLDWNSARMLLVHLVLRKLLFTSNYQNNSIQLTFNGVLCGAALGSTDEMVARANMFIEMKEKIQ